MLANSTTMKLTLPVLAVGTLAVAALAYPAANSFAVSNAPAAPALSSASMDCPASQGAAMAAQTTQNAVPSISQAALTKAIADKSATVIDVNGTDSYNAGHIPSALNFSEIKDLKTVLPKDKNALVVAYCGNEYCGAYKKAAEAAVALGYTNVQHFSPGIAGWKASGAPVEKA